METWMMVAYLVETTSLSTTGRFAWGAPKMGVFGRNAEISIAPAGWSRNSVQAIELLEQATKLNGFSKQLN